MWGRPDAFLSSSNVRLHFVDISKTRVLEHLKNHGGPNLVCDAHFLPFENETFDAVYSAAVTEHVACPQQVAQEVNRVLKPGGYYMGNCSFMEPWHDDSFFHLSPLGAFVDHIWPGKGYNGFRAIMAMGNRVTNKLSFMGSGIYWAYGVPYVIRNRIARKRGGLSIDQAARVAGAVDWIARRQADAD
jgi:SAM-dependent methyltransferase